MVAIIYHYVNKTILVFFFLKKRYIIFLEQIGGDITDDLFEYLVATDQLDHFLEIKQEQQQEEEEEQEQTQVQVQI